MPPDYATYTTADFLDDASFLAWGRGEVAATAFWENWLAGAPPNAAAARAARQQLRLLLAATPVPIAAHTLRFIWLDVQQTLAERQARTRRRAWQWASAAAVVAGVAIGGWLLRPAVPAAGLAVTTAYGQLRQLTLADGTQVTLNAHSSLRHGPWQANQAREVWLRGEALFQVRHLDRDGQVAPSERFVVHTGSLDVEVIGTTFNVKQRRALTQVVVQNGRVRVWRPGRSQAVVLAPQEEARYDSTRGQLLKLPAGSTAAALAWTNRQLLLHHTPVADIMQVMQDTYGYRTVLATPGLATRQVDGVLPLTSPESVLRVLSSVLGAPVTRRDSTIYIGQPQ